MKQSNLELALRGFQNLNSLACHNALQGITEVLWSQVPDGQSLLPLQKELESNRICETTKEYFHRLRPEKYSNPLWGKWFTLVNTMIKYGGNGYKEGAELAKEAGINYRRQLCLTPIFDQVILVQCYMPWMGFYKEIIRSISPTINGNWMLLRNNGKKLRKLRSQIIRGDDVAPVTLLNTVWIERKDDTYPLGFASKQMVLKAHEEKIFLDRIRMIGKKNSG